VNCPGIHAAASVLPGRFGSYGPSGKDAFALAPDLGIDLFERRHLGRGEAVPPGGAGFALGKIARRLKVAAPRIVDDAILQSVLGVAALVDPGGKRGQFAGRERRGL